jgi:glycosyltransferase involved in cell wall biosynthesis
VRLLYLTDRLSDRGGADHHLAQVMASSVDDGFEVRVAYGRDDGGTDRRPGVEYRRVRGLSSMVDSGSRIGGLEALLATADVVHVQNIMNPTALAMAVECGCAVVTVQDHRVFCPGQGKTLNDGRACTVEMTDTVCRECVPDDLYRQSTLGLTRRRLDALRGAEIVVLSRYMAEQLEVVGARPARVIPPWVEIGPDRTDSGSSFVLGGRLVAHKGIMDGWQAWARAGRPLRLVVAGSGPLESELSGADCLGWLAQEDLRAALRNARALIFPARWQEPFGILGLEALAQGTPVVVAESGGTGDWSGSGCIRVPAGDVEAMADAIRRLAADPEWAMELGREGRSAVGRLFARDRIEPMLAELYRSVALSRAELS